MFSLTHELSYYRIRDVTSARFHYSIMEGLINCLWNIGNPISEAFKVLCIMQSITDEYSPYIFKFIETCEDPMLTELYEVMCKAEDDLRINPLDKTNKYKVIDEENDEQVTGRTEGLFYEPLTKKRTVFPKYFNALLETSWYGERIKQQRVVSLHKWESERIMCNQTTAFTTGLHRNAEGHTSAHQRGQYKQK
ncbi:hypothetical protein Tco_1068366 [Tanacetum coccineum]|uniref:Uncharacterized protein n=1 Tax=Tanacetum coccineum TaxID=301880 RepID=A0ABQ5HFM1_9ASTR